jgi:alpha-L-rhamnosidase
MHAFRYVRIKGAGIVAARALQISAVNPKEGATFECSDPRLNAIHDMVKYTLSCLTFSGYMVDCPHIERMGYGGDGNSSTMTLQTIWDVRDTYRNWLTAWGDAMDSTGDLPYVAPSFRTGGGPYWSGFIVKAPWRTYLNYGDSTLIHRHYHQMKLWLQFVEKHCVDGILQPWPDNNRRGWFLGDWLAPEGVDIGGESVLHVSNCFLAECLADMIQMATLLHRPDDSLRFDVWRQSLIPSIHSHFYHPESHTYANGTPLDQCYALLQGIPPDSTTSETVKKQLLKDIHGRYHDHLAVGLVGVPIFTEWCIREHQADLMANLLRQPDYPGYLNMINNGATTTWESWDCGREGKEDRSRVHNCYNGIGIWFYQAVAGIRPDPEHPGYKHFFIDPQPVEGLTWVKATKPTAYYGTILIEIKNKKLKIFVPKNTTATVFPDTPRECTVEAGEWIFEL